MISEVDIRDWQASMNEAYTEFVAERGGDQVYGSEVWEAAANWAFEYMWERANNDTIMDKLNRAAEMNGEEL